MEQEKPNINTAADIKKLQTDGVEAAAEAERPDSAASSSDDENYQYYEMPPFPVGQKRPIFTDESDSEEDSDYEDPNTVPLNDQLAAVSLSKEVQSDPVPLVAEESASGD